MQQMESLGGGGSTSEKLTTDSRRMEGLQTGTCDGGDLKLFISSDRKSSFESVYCNRKVYYGKRVDLSDFGDPDIPAMIDAAGWTPIITMDLPIFPRLVRLFYCNMEFDREAPSITSLVNGTPVHLTCDSLGAMLGIPNDGARYYYSKKQSFGDGFDGPHCLDAFRLVFGDEKALPAARTTGEIRFLPARNRVLHSIVRSMFLPRWHNRKVVVRKDLFVMKKVLFGERASLPFMMIHHMIDSLSSNHPLPYGMLLTKIFMACNVHVPGHEPYEMLKKSDVYSSMTFCHKGYVWTEAGWAIRRKFPARARTAGPNDDYEETLMQEEEEDETMEVDADDDDVAIVTEEAWRLRRGEDLPRWKRRRGRSCSSPTTTEAAFTVTDHSHTTYEFESKQLAARIDTLAATMEQGFAKLTAKLEATTEFLNQHFWPYPPPPAPFL